VECVNLIVELEYAKVNFLNFRKKKMNTLERLELLSENCSDRTELDRILGQILSVILTRHRQKLAIYDDEIHKFEQRYHLDSEEFLQQFNSGILGDNMDFLSGLVYGNYARIF
jgi:hypothetical protein